LFHAFSPEIFAEFKCAPVLVLLSLLIENGTIAAAEAVLVAGYRFDLRRSARGTVQRRVKFKSKVFCEPYHNWIDECTKP